MSKQGEILKKIGECEEEIDSLEKQRMRSQSMLLQALVDGESPNPVDVEYFKTYTQLIEVERANIKKLNKELAKLKK